MVAPGEALANTYTPEGTRQYTNGVEQRQDAPSERMALCVRLSDVVAARRASARQQVHRHPERLDATHQLVPLEPATTRGRRAEHARCCSPVIHASAVRGRRARRRLALATPWCLGQATEANKRQRHTPRKRSAHIRTAGINEVERKSCRVHTSWTQSQFSCPVLCAPQPPNTDAQDTNRRRTALSGAVSN